MHEGNQLNKCNKKYKIISKQHFKENFVLGRYKANNLNNLID